MNRRFTFLLSILPSAAALSLRPSAALAQDTPSYPATTMPSAVAPVAGKRVYTAADFARFAPKTAYDMLVQVPGFTIRSAEQQRGLGQASENVLLNGQRISSKSGGAISELQRIAAGNVEQIEIVDAATLDIAGLSGQVANVIAKSKRSSGQFAWRPESGVHYSDPLYTRGSVSYSGTKGALDYTLSLDNSGAWRTAADGPEKLLSATGQPIEFRTDVWRNNYDSPKFSGRLTWNRGKASVANATGAYTPYWSSYTETSHRDPVDGIDRIRETRDRTRGYSFELGGDYAFPVGGGALKLIGLRYYRHDPFRSTSIFRFADGSPDEGSRFERDGRNGEWIARGEYSWKTGRGDWQISAEAAFNRLDSVSRLFVLSPGGEFDQIDFSGGTGRVHEDRYEVLATHGRPLSNDLSLQLVAGGEYSKLSSSTDIASVTRNFFRPKGSLSLAWKANAGLDLSFRIRRRVGQLNFYDFLASVSLVNDRENDANLSLVPPQSWEAEVEFNKKLSRWGTTTLRLFGRRYDDIVDIIPVGANGQAVGNIDRAVLYGFESKSTLLFDAIGWRGAKLDASVLMQWSRLTDPLTGEKRPISGQTHRQIQVNFRHDIPDSRWAWGASANQFYPEKTFRLTEVGRVWEGPFFVALFVEDKDLMGLTVRATVANVLNARHRWHRHVFEGRRDTSPIFFIQRTNQRLGPTFSLSVRGNF